jgi:plasmid stabilization system protein ParE
LNSDRRKGAANVKARLFDVIAALAEHPRIGRLTRKRHVRRVAATPYPYLVFYRATASEIIVDTVQHAARRRVG